jgi:hypothetical protein
VVNAEVVYATPAFAFAVGGDGKRFFVNCATCPPEILPLRVGDQLTLTVDPDEVVPPGRRARAIRVAAQNDRGERA